MKSTTLLIEDHKHMLRALRVLEAISMSAECGHPTNESDVRDIVEFLVGFGDRIHQGREESILFPALLRDNAQKHYPELYGLIFDHNRQRSLIEGLQESMLSKEKKVFVYCARRLVGILRHHIQEEEDSLFPLANSTLSPDEDACVAADMEAQDKAWHDENIPRLFRRLDCLEANYCTKPPTRLRSRSVV